MLDCKAGRSRMTTRSPITTRHSLPVQLVAKPVLRPGIKLPVASIQLADCSERNNNVELQHREIAAANSKDGHTGHTRNSKHDAQAAQAAQAAQNSEACSGSVRVQIPEGGPVVQVAQGTSRCKYKHNGYKYSLRLDRATGAVRHYHKKKLAEQSL